MKITLATHDIFFISDFHFFHNNVIKFDERPFDNVMDMHKTIIENWNKVVGKDSIVFYLGDLSFSDYKRTAPFVKRLNGHIHFILGNHDKESDIKKYGFESVSDYIDLSIIDNSIENSRPKYRQKISLFHYPVLSWNGFHYNSWMLHGHSHGNLMISYPMYYSNKVLDVSCNVINYTPISYNELKIMFKYN